MRASRLHWAGGGIPTINCKNATAEVTAGCDKFPLVPNTSCNWIWLMKNDNKIWQQFFVLAGGSKWQVEMAHLYGPTGLLRHCCEYFCWCFMLILVNILRYITSKKILSIFKGNFMIEFCLLMYTSESKLKCRKTDKF